MNFRDGLCTIAAPAQPTSYIYDTLGKMVEVTQGAQKRNFLYDSLGRLLRVRQPEQNINASLNLADSVTGNSQWTAGFTYDDLGNVLTATDAKGTTITNAYDALSRVQTRSYSDGTPTVTHSYDDPNVPYSKGKLTRISNLISTSQTTAFDILGRSLTYQQITDGTTYTSQYQYNLSGALKQETYPSGRVVKNEFEADGDLSRIYGKVNANSPEKTYANNFTYTADGKIKSLQLGNSLWESAQFNSRLQVTELNLGRSATDGSLWKLAYEYGELQADGATVDATKNTGNIAKQTISFDGLAQPFVQAFRYDALYRLTQARETSGGNQTWLQNFGYDRYGNRTAFAQQGGTVPAAQPTIDPSTNRFTTGQGYTYDFNGNLIGDADGRQFTFNGDNKQTEVRDANNVVIGRYFYDGDGKRIKKLTNTETTVFVYSGSKLVAEYSTAAPPANPTTSYTATDQVGSPRVITNASGEVVSRRDFMPFGEQLTIDGVNRTAALKYNYGDDIRQKFTGYQRDDETGLDFAEARYYNNSHGRFTAVDPLLASGKSANPQTFNRYAYVLNNPLRLTDPSGLQAGRWIMPAEPDGRQGYQYLDNSQPVPSGSTEVTQRNNRGELIGSGAGLDANHVIRFNPDGPLSDVFRDELTWMLLSDYHFQGYDFIRTDEAQAAFMRTGQVDDAITPLDVALVLTPVGKGGNVAEEILGSKEGISTVQRYSAMEFKFTDSIRKSSLKANADSIFLDGIQNPIDFTTIKGEKYILNGNNRTALARRFGQTVPAQEQSLPFGSWRNEGEVLNNHSQFGNTFASPTVRKFFDYYKPPQSQ